MSVFIKEYDAANVGAILPFLYDDVKAYKYSEGAVLLDDIVICSKYDQDFLNANKDKYKCFIYEDINKRILDNLSKEYFYNYDYYHLQYELERGKKKDIATLISGSSYGVFGIELCHIKNTVNLSMISQDLYYSLRGIYEVCSINENIRNIVLFTPYYYFFSDLSRTQNEDEITRVSKVYDQLYNDLHACVLLPPKYNVLYKSEIFNIPRLMDALATQECKKGYFCANRTRRDCATRIWDDKDKSWLDIDVSQKTIAGKTRALSHMEACKYTNSLEENRLYFQDFVSYILEKGIKLLLVVPPSTKYYSDYISDECKNEFFKTIDRQIVNCLDLTNDPRFEEDDFNDMDHLNDQGAVKMTKIISDTLYR